MKMLRMPPSVTDSFHARSGPPAPMQPMPDPGPRNVGPQWQPNPILPDPDPWGQQWGGMEGLY